MRILLHHACYDMDDKAELGVIEATASWLSATWPAAQIGVLTDSPSRVSAFLPSLVPLVYDSPLAWPRNHRPRPHGQVGGPAGLYNGAPAEPQLRQVLRTVDDSIAGADDEQAPPPALRQSTLVVCVGGRCLSDDDPRLTQRTLAILDGARQLSIPVVMSGQGIGPLDDPPMLDRVARALAGVDLLGLREGRFSPATVQRLGVPLEHVELAGDDLMTAVRPVRTPAAGRDIGLNMTVTGESALSPDETRAIGHSLARVATRQSTFLSPIVVSERLNQDRVGARTVLGDASPVRPEASRLASPRELFTQIGRCRVVITSGYGAAVVALAQGVPVVAIARRRAAVEAFEGLAADFPAGCRVISPDMVGLEEAVEVAVTRAWQEAPDLRAELRCGADRSVEASEAFRSRAAEVVARRVTIGRSGVATPA